MSANKSFYCKLCEQTWDELPPDAVRLTSNRGRGHANLYRFSDGTPHSIVIVRTHKEEKQS